MPIGVTKKALAHNSQPLFPYKSNDMIYVVEIHGSSEYMPKQDVRIYDVSTSTSVDSCEIVMQTWCSFFLTQMGSFIFFNRKLDCFGIYQSTKLQISKGNEAA